MEHILNVNSFWGTRDFYLGSVVLASGAPLVKLERGNKNFVTFIFKISPEEAEGIISRHWSRKVSLPTRDLIEAINELKTRLHSGT